MADRVPRETGGKAEGARHKVLRLGQQDSGLPRLGERMRGGDQIAPSGFPLCFVTLIPDLASYPGHAGKKEWPGIHCSRMRKNLRNRVSKCIRERS